MLVLLLSHLAPFLFAPNFLLMMSTPSTHQMLLESQMDPVQSEVGQTEQVASFIFLLVHTCTCTLIEHNFFDT